MINCAPQCLDSFRDGTRLCGLNHFFGPALQSYNNLVRYLGKAAFSRHCIIVIVPGSYMFYNGKEKLGPEQQRGIYMTEDKKENACTCSICGQIREEHQLIRLPKNTYCIFCHEVLKEWATQVGHDRKILIERLDTILRDMLAEEKGRKEENQ
jgi:hypothetical protein